MYVLNVHNGDKSNNIYPINIDDYPAIKKHLDKYWDKISIRADKGDTPYNLRNCIYTDLFLEQKIIYSEIVQSPRFYLDEKRFFVEASAFILTGENLNYLVKILNSKVFTFAFKKYYAGGGLGEKGYRYKKEFILKLPVPHAQDAITMVLDSVNDEAIENCLKNILNLTNDEYKYIINNTLF